MSIDEVEGLLKKDALFSYHGPSDVSLLPSPNMSLIEVEGLSFVKRAFFQFYDGKLWVMVFFLNSDKIDHYSIYSSLTGKYGDPRPHRSQGSPLGGRFHPPCIGAAPHPSLYGYGRLQQTE